MENIMTVWNVIGKLLDKSPVASTPDLRMLTKTRLMDILTKYYFLSYSITYLHYTTVVRSLFSR